MTRRTVRAIQVVAGATVAAMLIAGCGSSSKPAADSNTIGPITGSAASSVVPWAASGQAADTTVTVCFFSGPEFDTIQKHAPDFTALTGGKIKVKMVSIPIAQALPVTINQLSTSSDCDLVDGASEHATDLNPYLLPLTSMMADPALLKAHADKIRSVLAEEG